MRHSQLSNEQMLLALSESYSIVAAITKYQVFLASGIGLPKGDTARSEIMTASANVVEKLRLRSEPSNMNLIVEKIRKKTVFKAH